MCDYSLMALPNRLAQAGEELVVYRFRTGSLGLASVADLNRRAQRASIVNRNFWTSLKEFFNPPEICTTPAVCIPPGARLMLHGIPSRLRSGLGIDCDEEVTFTQIDSEVNTYRDAVRFRCGQQIRLQELQEGQHVEVLDLASEEDQPIPSSSTLSRGEPQIRQIIA